MDDGMHAMLGENAPERCLVADIRLVDRKRAAGELPHPLQGLGLAVQ